MTTPTDLMNADELERHANPDGAGGCGALGTERGNLPLDEIDVRAVITGLTVRTEVAQGFHNPYTAPLEATYIFPLPDRAAVTAMRMEADGRTVEGVLEERGAARASYDRAVAAGQRASIAEQERADVFTVRVGNIMPGKRVTVRLTLVGRLPYEDDAATFRFPLVVAPRYVPGEPLPGGAVGDGVAPDTDAVPDASRISPPVLLPGFPNPVRLSVRVDVDPAGLPLTGVRSSLHAVRQQHGDDDATGGRTRIELLPGERVDRDFVLRLGFGAHGAVSTALALRPDMASDVPSELADDGAAGGAVGAGAGTFMLTVLPPADGGYHRDPRDVVLVLDRSGSMAGWKIVAARRAAARIVDSLTDADRFAVLSFDSVIEQPDGLPNGLAPASDRNRFRAVEHVAGIDARGGTAMLEPLRRAADLLRAATPGRQRALVLVTDGQVGNEDQILRALAAPLAGVRVYTVGVDTAVNAGFLRGLAAIGGGRCELVESEDRLDEAMRAIHHRIGTPLVTDLRVEPGQLPIDAGTVTPARSPDLFAGVPVVITGRLTGTPGDVAPPRAGAVTVTGTAADGGAWHRQVPVTVADDASLPAVWAKARVRELEDRYTTLESGGWGEHVGLEAVERDIVATSLRFRVLSRFTAFVAVDDRVVNEGGQRHRVTQPVELPAGWSQPGDAMLRAVPMAAPAPGSAPLGALRRPRPAESAAAPGYDEAYETSPSLPSAMPVPPRMPSPAVDFVDEVDVPDFLKHSPKRATADAGVLPAPRRFAVELWDLLLAMPDESGGISADALARVSAEIRRRIEGLRADGLSARWVDRLRTLAASLVAPLPAAEADAAADAELRHRWTLACQLFDELCDDLRDDRAEATGGASRDERADDLPENARTDIVSPASPARPTPPTRGSAFWKR